MKPTFITLLLLILFSAAFAQVQPYGKIDTADLKLTECDFEKGANAMVLFDKGEMFCYNYSTVLKRHKRIKILTDKGMDRGNIRLEYISAIEDIDDVVAQTINLDGNTITYTPVDKKQIFKEKIDKYRKALIIAMPQVRKGSVIELKYKWSGYYKKHYPRWYFQTYIPVRYSEITANLKVETSVFTKIKQNFAANIRNTDGTMAPMTNARTLAMSKVHAYIDEPFMPLVDDGLQRIMFYDEPISSWSKVAGEVKDDIDFGQQLGPKLPADSIWTRVAAIKDSTKKIEALFNFVKNNITWNNINNWYTEDGLKRAWNKRKGNSTEVNLILYNLLTKAGIKSYPVLVSSPDNGTVEPDFPTVRQFDKTVLYVPVDTASYYILDATNKHNSYNIIPHDFLNGYGLAIYAAQKANKRNFYNEKGLLFTIASSAPVKEIILINAEIDANGKMSGNADINSYSYNRQTIIKQKDEKGKDYTNYVKDYDNTINVTSLKFENLEIDSLPLRQIVDFSMDLTQSDDNYLYLKTNLFSRMRTNPFLSETRYADIQFPHPVTTIITGLYKIPATLKVETLPKTIQIKSTDNDISIKRMIAQEGNMIAVRYTVEQKRLNYIKEDYQVIREFYKKMFEILNEPIVLKKS